MLKSPNGGMGESGLLLGYKSAKIPNSLYSGGGGGGGDQLSYFDAESKSAKIPNSLYSGEEELLLVTNFQLLMLSPNLLKYLILYRLGLVNSK